MTTRSNVLQDHIDDHLDAFDSLEELSDERYHTTHEKFEAVSNQRELILDRLNALASRHDFPKTRATRLLSVGCGGGVMDQKIVDVFRGLGPELSLAGVDPNPEHTAAFEQRFSSQDVDTEIFTGFFSKFQPANSFDIIHFVHCLYYFKDIESDLCRAVEMLAPNGLLTIFHAPHEALNHMADRVWEKQFNRSIWYSDEVVAALEKFDLDIHVQRLDAEVDVTACMNMDSDLGTDILDFIVQADTRQFEKEFRTSLLDGLRSIACQQGDRFFCAHPVDAIVARHR